VDSEIRQTAEFQVGATIGKRYEIVSHLGSGAMGLVLKVRDRALDNDILALKILYPHLLQDETLFQRFMNEVVIARKLTHPNIVRTHDIGRDERGYYYISMEYIEGKSLASRIYDKQNPLSFDEALGLLTQIASGLAYAHERGVIHRDLKPENIMLSADGTPRIADFGLAESLWIKPGLTKTGESVGTPAYMAPEQIQGDEIDARADIYAFGIMAYEMAACDRPYKDENWFKIAAQHILEPLPPLIANQMILPAWYEPFVQKCTEKRPDDRFQSAKEIVEALESINRPAADRTPEFQSFASTLQQPNRRAATQERKSPSFLIWGGGIATILFCFLVLVFAALPKGTKQSVLFSIEQSFGFQLTPLKRAFGIHGQQSNESFLAAAKNGDTTALDGMITAGIDVNTRDTAGTGKTALMMAVEAERVAATETLAKLTSVDKDAIDNSQRTALSYALEKKNKALVETLLRYGASITKDAAPGKNALHFAISVKTPLSIVELLLDEGKIDVNGVDGEGYAPLVRAVLEKNEPLALLLIEKGADRNAVDPKDGSSVAAIASANKLTGDDGRSIACSITCRTAYGRLFSAEFGRNDTGKV
jgi:serine/threonine protein kinase